MMNKRMVDVALDTLHEVTASLVLDCRLESDRR
jgi:hypothetical protein